MTYNISVCSAVSNFNNFDFEKIYYDWLNGAADVISASERMMRNFKDNFF